jgi:CubicO group peptidase (beta-lactamase class C family)
MTVTITTSQIERIQAVIETAVEAGNFSGVVLVTQGETTLLEEAHGFAHRGFAIENTPAMRFDIASVTKLFTAVSTLQLVERGDFALDTPVIPFLDLTGTAISHDVTVRHPLTHSSGIADDADEEAGEDYDLLFVDTPNYRFRNTVDQLPHFVHKEPNFAPGEGVRYNNAGFLLLGLMIEKVSGLTYHDYVRQHVFERAGMQDADFLALDEINHNLAEHYRRIEHDSCDVVWRKNIYAYPPVGDPAGGATVTARDLDTFLRALRDEQLLGPELTAEMLTPHVKSHDYKTGGSCWYGYATQIDVGDDGTISAWGKDGQNSGVASNTEILPDLDVAVILLANQDCNVWSLDRDIDRILRETDD